MTVVRDTSLSGRVSGAGDALLYGRIIGLFAESSRPLGSDASAPALAALTEVQHEVAPEVQAEVADPSDPGSWRRALRALLQSRDRQVAGDQQKVVRVQIERLESAIGANDTEEVRYRFQRLVETLEATWK